MAELEKRWYVIRAVSGKEKKVKEYIESEIIRNKLEDYVFNVLIPTEKVYQIRNGKKITKERSYFPGYILMEAILMGEVAHVIKNVTGVLGFLTDKGNEPIPLRMYEVNRILGTVDNLEQGAKEAVVPFVEGETVKVIDGPFNSFSGVIVDVNEDKKKLKVMVKIFGRKTPVELSYMQVEKE